jgi:hypothetical protein
VSFSPPAPHFPISQSKSGEAEVRDLDDEKIEYGDNNHQDSPKTRTDKNQGFGLFPVLGGSVGYWYANNHNEGK